MGSNRYKVANPYEMYQLTYTAVNDVAIKNVNIFLVFVIFVTVIQTNQQYNLGRIPVHILGERPIKPLNPPLVVAFSRTINVRFCVSRKTILFACIKNIILCSIDRKF